MTLIKLSMVASVTMLLNSDFLNEMSGLDGLVPQPNCPIRVEKYSTFLLFQFLCLLNDLCFESMI